MVPVGIGVYANDNCNNNNIGKFKYFKVPIASYRSIAYPLYVIVCVILCICWDLKVLVLIL